MYLSPFISEEWPEFPQVTKAPACCPGGRQVESGGPTLLCPLSIFSLLRGLSSNLLFNRQLLGSTTHWLLVTLPRPAPFLTELLMGVSKATWWSSYYWEGGSSMCDEAHTQYLVKKIMLFFFLSFKETMRSHWQILSSTFTTWEWGSQLLWGVTKILNFFSPGYCPGCSLPPGSKLAWLTEQFWTAIPIYRC